MTRFDSTSWSVVLGAAAAVPRDQEEFGRRYGPLVREPGAGYAHWMLAAHMAIAAARAAAEVDDRALADFERAIAAVTPGDGPGVRRAELGGLRWVQWDATVAQATWSPELRGRLEDLQVRLAARIRHRLTR